MPYKDRVTYRSVSALLFILYSTGQYTVFVEIKQLSLVNRRDFYTNISTNFNYKLEKLRTFTLYVAVIFELINNKIDLIFAEVLSVNTELSES